MQPSLAPLFVLVVAAFGVGARAQAALFQAADEIGACASDLGAFIKRTEGALTVAVGGFSLP